MRFLCVEESQFISGAALIPLNLGVIAEEVRAFTPGEGKEYIKRVVCLSICLSDLKKGRSSQRNMTAR